MSRQRYRGCRSWERRTVSPEMNAIQGALEKSLINTERAPLVVERLWIYCWGDMTTHGRVRSAVKMMLWTNRRPVDVSSPGHENNWWLTSKQAWCCSLRTQNKAHVLINLRCLQDTSQCLIHRFGSNYCTGRQLEWHDTSETADSCWRSHICSVTASLR